MSREVTLVEVILTEYKPGDKEYSDYLNSEIEFSSPIWEEVTEETPEVVKAKQEKETALANSHKFLTYPSLANEPDLTFTQACDCFSFRFIGQNFDRNYAGGMEWERSEMGADYLFDGWEEELKKIANYVRASKEGLFSTKESKIVRFITAWEWNSYKHSYYDEWDSDWKLLGLVNLNQIGNCLIKEF